MIFGKDSTTILYPVRAGEMARIDPDEIVLAPIEVLAGEFELTGLDICTAPV
jgi:hypothetical protein